eukprot:COSAG01_NODE_4695_length_4807_cov_113.303314_5_plen_90_part_00
MCAVLQALSLYVQLYALLVTCDMQLYRYICTALRSCTPLYLQGLPEMISSNAYIRTYCTFALGCHLQGGKYRVRRSILLVEVEYTAFRA